MRQKQTGTLGNPRPESDRTVGDVIYLMHYFAFSQHLADESFRLLSETYVGVFGVDLPVEARRVLKTTAARSASEFTELLGAFYAAAQASDFDARAWWFS